MLQIGHLSPRTSPERSRYVRSTADDFRLTSATEAPSMRIRSETLPSRVGLCYPPSTWRQDALARRRTHHLVPAVSSDVSFRHSSDVASSAKGPQQIATSAAGSERITATSNMDKCYRQALLSMATRMLLSHPDFIVEHNPIDVDIHSIVCAFVNRVLIHDNAYEAKHLATP